ncbi:hypothetical protein DFQ45_11187 [Thiopseudomonas denitrificans]|uniref:Uncharacterized protein n=1 Tax=Thiopseudomonas denitrificans TaxID=1501432 RepID=A0A4R6TUA2_9GAMM|nr:hypothetical protein DFQ45_11187 [Thiopseudomonas denitrificans]
MVGFGVVVGGRCYHNVVSLGIGLLLIQRRVQIKRLVSEKILNFSISKRRNSVIYQPYLFRHKVKCRNLIVLRQQNRIG